MTVNQSEAECQTAAGEDSAVDSSVSVDDNEYNVVTRDCSSLLAPFADLLATNTEYSITVASDKMNTHSATNNEEGSVVGVIESYSLPSAANVAPSIISSDISTPSNILGSVTRMSTVNPSSVEVITGSQKHDMNKGAELMSGVTECIVVKEENETLNCTVNEEVLDSMQSVCDNHYISGCSLDSAADLMSVELDMAVNRNPAVTEGCHRPVANSADDVMVAGILSTGTDMDHDGEGTLQKTTSTLCHVSQPGIAATNPLYSANTATSVTSSTSQFPFLEFLTTQSILSADNTTTSQLSTSANSLPTVNSVNLTETASCVSAVQSSAVSLESSLSSYSIAQSGTTLPPCQISSVTSLAMLPKLQHSVVSDSTSSNGMALLDLSQYTSS